MDYVQFLVNLHGARWLAKGKLIERKTNEYKMADASAIQAVVTRLDDAWIMEMAFPLTCLDPARRNIRHQDHWGFNWRRYRYADSKGGILGWSILPNVPARPDLFGHIRFIEDLK